MHEPLPSTLGPEAIDGPDGKTMRKIDTAPAAPYGDAASNPFAGALSDSRIGVLLQQAGKLTADGVERVVRLQQESGLPFGEAALRLGLLSREDIDAIVARQFAYPVVVRPDSALSPQLVAAFHPASAQGDTLRAIRSQLLLRWFALGHHGLAISGAESSDSSSVLAANLALVFAQLGHRTVLVDANLRHGVQRGLFGISAQQTDAGEAPASPGPGWPSDDRPAHDIPSHGLSRKGLSDVLAGRADFDAILPVPGFSPLSILPSGTVPPNPQELLERASFAALHTQLGKLYDVVLYDVAPTSHGAEALAVAAHAGGALLVAQKDRTPVILLKRLTQQMTAAGVTVVGSVMVEP